MAKISKEVKKPPERKMWSMEDMKSFDLELAPYKKDSKFDMRAELEFLTSKGLIKFKGLSAERGKTASDFEVRVIYSKIPEYVEMNNKLEVWRNLKHKTAFASDKLIEHYDRLASSMKVESAPLNIDDGVLF